MRSDSYLSAKGFKAAYKRACGATIRVKDQGILSTSSTLVLREEASNCSWILISDDPGKLNDEQSNSRIFVNHN